MPSPEATVIHLNVAWEFVPLLSLSEILVQNCEESIWEKGIGKFVVIARNGTIPFDSNNVTGMPKETMPPHLQTSRAWQKKKITLNIYSHTRDKLACSRLLTLFAVYDNSKHLT